VPKDKGALVVLAVGIYQNLLQPLVEREDYKILPIERPEAISAEPNSNHPRILAVDLEQASEDFLAFLRDAFSRRKRPMPLLALVDAESYFKWKKENFSQAAHFLLHPLSSAQFQLGIEQAVSAYRIQTDNRQFRMHAARNKLSQNKTSGNGRKPATASPLEIKWRAQLQKEEKIENLLEQIIHIAAKHCQARRASLMLYNRDTGALEIRHATGLDPAIVKKTQVQVGEGPSGHVAKTRKPLLVQDSLDFVVSNWKRRKQGPPSFASVPLMAGGRLIGVLNVTEKNDGALFNEEELQQLSRLALIASETLDQRLLLDGLSEGYLETLKVLARAIEHRDPFTSSHSERVCEYSLAIGRQLGLTSADLQILESAAMLHDIGKVGIPPSILYKPGPLDEKENQVLREHPSIGARLLTSLPHFEQIRQVAAHHHEWYNGQGYPDGLKGEQMSILIRIVAVADVFDALTSERPYRGGIDPELALEEILSLSGSQFDPVITEAFSQIMSESLEKTVSPKSA
jgi:putative nucleotidyltransferase with HDIG domain